MGRGRYLDRQRAAGTITRPAIGKRIGAVTLPFLPLFHGCLPSFLLCRRTDCPESGAALRHLWGTEWLKLRHSGHFCPGSSQGLRGSQLLTLTLPQEPCQIDSAKILKGIGVSAIVIGAANNSEPMDR